MKTFLIKLTLIAALTIFALYNYRFLSFDKGWSNFSINKNEDISAIVNIKSTPTKVEYYKKTFSNNEYIYRIFISTNEENYLLHARQYDIDNLDLIANFDKNIKPNLIKPIPFYVEIIIGLIILIIPFGRKNKNLNPT